MPTITEFLRNYEVELGKLDTDAGPMVERDTNAQVIVNDNNIEAYRDFGVDAIIEAAADFNTEHIEDQQGNLFGDSLFLPTVEAYYQSLPAVFGPQVAELLIRNSRGADECLRGDPSDRDIADCYIRRIFDSVVSAGIIRTFPIFSSPLSGSPIPIFNVMPSNVPPGFSTVFLSSVVPTSNASIFSTTSLLLDENFTKENRFVSSVPSTDLTTNEKDTLDSIFQPKNANIDFEYGPEVKGPSKSAVIFEADLQGSPTKSLYNVNISFGSFSDTLEAVEDQDFYRTGSGTGIFKLEVYVTEQPVTITGPNITNVQNIEILNGAPFFEDGGDWFFVSEEPSPFGLDRMNIIDAKIFDPPEFDISDIQDKAFNRGYDGFGATAYRGGQSVPANESILADFFSFYKDYVETNFAVIHIGLSTNGVPTVSAPEQLNVTLDD